jgi:DNA polymerase-4/protein ImuB
MKILCVMMPHFPWSCEVLRQPSLNGKPAIVVYSTGSQKLVLDWSPEMTDLQQDMPLQQALAHHGQVGLISADIPHYRSVFTELLEALEGISSLVEDTELGRAYISIDGLQLLYPNDDAIINAIFDVVPNVFKSQIGIAGNKFMAYVAARLCPDGGYQAITNDGNTFLKDLSCDVLPISIKNKEKLQNFGICTLGQVADLPVGPLLSQFGVDGKKIAELSRGIDDTPLYPWIMEEAIEKSVTLTSVTVSMEVILLSLEALLVDILSSISRSRLGISSLTVWTRTWGSELWEREIKFKEPAMGTKTAVNRIRRILEDYPQPGPVEQVGIKINRLGYPRGRQGNILREVRSRDHLLEDIHQLELRLGGPQVYRVKEVEPWSRIPERRYVLAPTNQ